MNNPENGFFKKHFKKIIGTGVGIGMAAGAIAGSPEKPVTTDPDISASKNVTLAKETVTPKGDSVASFSEAQAIHQYNELAAKTTAFQETQTHRSAEVTNTIADFKARLAQVFKEKGYHTHVENQQDANDHATQLEKNQKHATMESLTYLPQQVADIARSMGEQYVNKQDITSEASLDGIMGILLSESGPLGKEAGYFTQLLQGSVGSTVLGADFNNQTGKRMDVGNTYDQSQLARQNAQTGHNSGTHIGGVNQDMAMRTALMNDLRAIVKATLEDVKAHEQNKLATKQMEDAKNAVIHHESKDQASIK